MTLTPTALRNNIYEILDGVLETGKPAEIVRNGQYLRIVAVDSPRKKKSRLARIKKHSILVHGSFESLVDINWSDEWKPE